MVMRAMTQAEYIISKFGGINAMARCLSRPPTTVQGWKERGSIPERWWRGILTAAVDAEIDLKPEDFAGHLLINDAHAAA